MITPSSTRQCFFKSYAFGEHLGFRFGWQCLELPRVHRLCPCQPVKFLPLKSWVKPADGGVDFTVCGSAPEAEAVATIKLVARTIESRLCVISSSLNVIVGGNNLEDGSSRDNGLPLSSAGSD